MTTEPDPVAETDEDRISDGSGVTEQARDPEQTQISGEPISGESFEPTPPLEPTVFAREKLAPTMRWVWLGGYLIPAVVLAAMLLPFDVIFLDTPTGVATAGVLIVLAGVAVWRTITRYRNWSWELDRTELIIDRGVVFKLTRVVPRVRVQHVDITSGPLDRFFGLRQIRIYTAGTREADATIPGLTEATAESLRQALIRR